MSWNNLFNKINEELNENKPIIKKKQKESALFEQIAREILDEKIDVAGAVSKVAKSIKTGWQKLVGKIKEVASTGWRLGAAIGKTIAGKFVLFNKAGKILTPEMENISFEKIASGKKALTLETKTKAGNIPIHMSEKLDFGFGTTMKGKYGVMVLVKPRKAGVEEGVDYDSSEILLEDETGDIETISDIDHLVFRAFSGEGSKALSKEYEKPRVSPVEVDYDDFNEELTSLLDRVKSETVLKESKIKNLAIYAPTGWGKSHIIKTTADAAGYHYFPLELAKVDINVIAGFPYLSDIEQADDETKEDRLERASKIVRLAPSEFLPPSGATDSWLLFFDEFNRADTEKMAAVMNLLLTGELGGAANLVRDKKTGEKKLDRYKLPEKTVVVLAMNTGQQEGIEEAMNAVKNLDIATLERTHRVLVGKYHAASWIRGFGGKAFKAETKGGKAYWLPERVPPIILNFIAEKTKEAGKQEAAFLLPVTVAAKEGEQLGGGGERTTSPRSWTMVADDMIERGIVLFNKLSDDVKNTYKPSAEKLMKVIRGKNPDAPKEVNEYLFAAWMDDGRNQIKLLSKQSAELGDEGPSYVGQMIRSFIKKGKEGLTIEDLLFNYGSVREMVKANFKGLGFGTEAQLLAKIYRSLSGYKSEKEILDFMDSKGIPIVSKQGIISQIFQVLKALAKDLDINPDDMIAFSHLIESGAKDRKSEVLVALHRKLAGKWEAYREALKKGLKTKSGVVKELEKLSGKGKKKSEKEKEDEDLKAFIAKMELINE